MTLHHAWLLDFGRGLRAAVGEREILHIAYAPALNTVPLTPPHCSQVMTYDTHLLPAWDVAVWLGAAVPGRPCNVAAIVGFHCADGFGRGALLLADVPRRLQIVDIAESPLPANMPRWRAITHACCTYEGQALPILDLEHMFSSALAAGRAAA